MEIAKLTSQASNYICDAIYALEGNFDAYGLDIHEHDHSVHVWMKHAKIWEFQQLADFPVNLFLHLPSPLAGEGFGQKVKSTSLMDVL